MSAPEVEQVWITGCSRCANEGTSYADTEPEAQTDLIGQGWTREGWRTYCPACNDETRGSRK